MLDIGSRRCREIDRQFVMEEQIDGTERRAERALRHVRIAIVHITGLLKRRRSVADCLENPGFPCKEGQYQKNCDKDIQAFS